MSQQQQQQQSDPNFLGLFLSLSLFSFPPSSFHFFLVFIAPPPAEKAGREEAIKDAEVELKRIREFLKRCVTDPFIDFDQLIKQTHGTIEQEFAKKGKEYLDVYNNFENILGRTIDKSGAGAWGPGELGLLMLSNPVKKGTKGDIMTVANLQVEVKASKKATAGARLNVEQATKGNLTKDYNEVLRKYFGDSVKIYSSIGEPNFHGATCVYGVYNCK